jgi:crossover junction endodeoxyribonuclease RusA
VTATVAFYAPGCPIPQGNKSGILRGGKVVIVEGRTGKARNAFTEWRATLRQAAEAAKPPGPPLDGPLAVHVHFALPRPASAPKRRRTFADKRPDLDKLVRACLDALAEAAVIVDDARVVHLTATKDYPGPDGRIGAWVYVLAADPEFVDRDASLMRCKVAAEGRWVG